MPDDNTPDTLPPTVSPAAPDDTATVAPSANSDSEAKELNARLDAVVELNAIKARGMNFSGMATVDDVLEGKGIAPKNAGVPEEFQEFLEDPFPAPRPVMPGRFASQPPESGVSEETQTLEQELMKLGKLGRRGRQAVEAAMHNEPGDDAIALAVDDMDWPVTAAEAEKTDAEELRPSSSIPTAKPISTTPPSRGRG